MRMGRGHRDPRPALTVAIAALISGVLLALLAPSLIALAVGLWLMFTGINSLEALLPATVTRLAPGRLRGTALGIFATCQFLGIFVGGAAAGAAVALGGSSAVAAIAALSAFIWLAAIWFRPLVPVLATTSGE